MLGQLDRLVTLSTMPTIRFGVIPFEAKLPLAPVHGFWLMDERLVVVENFTASQNLTQASEVSTHVCGHDHDVGNEEFPPGRATLTASSTSASAPAVMAAWARARCSRQDAR